MEPSAGPRSSACSASKLFQANGIELPYGIHEAPHREEKPDCEVNLVVWQPPRPPKKKFWFSASKGDCCDAMLRAFKHWAVLCTMEVGGSFLLDAVEKDGTLVARMQMNDVSTKPIEKISLGVHRLDFNDISAAYRAVSVPGKYSKIENNCQEWVVDLLRTLKIILPPQVKTIAQLIPRVRLMSDIKKKNVQKQCGDTEAHEDAVFRPSVKSKLRWKSASD